MPAALSGQTTVTTAGTSVALGAGTTPAPTASTVVITAMPTNTGTIYVGNAGDDTVSAANGSPLAPGERVVIELTFSKLSDIRVNAATSGDKAAWLIAEDNSN